MRDPILKAVSMPVRFLWAPFAPAAANMTVQFTMMLFWVGEGGNPLVFMTSIFITHLILVVYGTKDPHLSNMFQSQGPFLKSNQTMHKTTGRKYAP